MFITSQKYISKTGPIIIFLSLVIFTVPGVQAAANNSALASIETKNIKISAGKSIVLRSDSPIKRVSIANPDIADFILLSPQEIYITAKAIGMTNLTLWQNGGVTAIYDLVVGSDISDLKQQLHEILPEEKELRVMATNDSITLAGKVSNAANLSQVLALAKAYAPEGNVQNLVTVGGVHQVMLKFAWLRCPAL